MKFKYIKRLLSVSIASAVVVSSCVAPASAELLTSEPAEDSVDIPVEEPIIVPTEEPVIIPTEAPAEPTEAPAEPTDTPVTPTDTPVTPTDTPATPTDTPVTPTDTPVTPTDTPATPTDTPVTPTDTPVTPTDTPVTPTDVPGEDIDEIIRKLIKRIQDLAELPKITLDQKEEIQAIRNIYDSLTDEQREQITNYEKFKKMEEELKALLGEASDELTDGSDIDELASQIGDAVYYTNYVSNLHVGKEFYLNSLKDNYGLSFSDDFAKVMNEIEEEYKDKYKLRDVSDQKSAKTTSSEDVLLVRNWQDILAIYVYEEMLDGKSSFTLDSSAKKDLSKIFAEMNPVERNKSDITKVAYGNRHINYYIKKHNVDTDGREVLKKYTETDCKLLCAVVTASKGFVRESVGENVSEERVNVISAAYSLIGEVGYFYGGKSNVIGTDDSWGQAEKVTAEGSTSTGTLRAYGLDCSGFVTWSVINGYQNTDMQDVIGDGTSEQWEKANVVSEKDAQPGDLVFLAGPERTGADNHVGIICGKTDAGDWIAVHCSSAKNGVTVGEAYSASFRYIRQPSFYPSENEMQQMAASGSAVSDLLTDHGTDGEDSAQVSMIVLVDDADVEPFDPSELPAHASVSAILQTEDTDTETSAASVPEEESQDAAASSDTAETTETPVLVDNSIVEPF